ncbi:MAG: ribbon-helix-helix domain-containing protein [Pseudomonadota bacterium]|nr:ribbon-helix-helix domain-containing protein [Pseudomonadota bacterium]
MDKTSAERQQRYRNQITKGDKKRLQVVLDRQDAETLDKICKTEGISKTDFVRKAIESWSQNETI